MRRPLILAAVFILSATLGVVLQLLTALALSFIQIAIMMHTHPNTSGIGAVTGGVAEASALLVPALSGVVGTLIALRRMDRTKSHPQS